MALSFYAHLLFTEKKYLAVKNSCLRNKLFLLFFKKYVFGVTIMKPIKLSKFKKDFS